MSDKSYQQAIDEWFDRLEPVPDEEQARLETMIYRSLDTVCERHGGRKVSEKPKHECCFEAGQALHCGSDHWWMWVGMWAPNTIIEKYAAAIYFCPWCGEKLEVGE